jgi:predicted transcriptional regulator
MLQSLHKVYKQWNSVRTAHNLLESYDLARWSSSNDVPKIVNKVLKAKGVVTSKDSRSLPSTKLEGYMYNSIITLSLKSTTLDRVSFGLGHI